MRIGIFILLILVSSLTAFSQKVDFTGVAYDPNGAVVINAVVKAIDKKGKAVEGNTSNDGWFVLKLEPGLYSISVSANGFLTIEHPEFFVVNSTHGKVQMDFVLFGARYHEPCGISGADCLPAKALIKSYEVRYSPKLKEIREEFDPNVKTKEN